MPFSSESLGSPESKHNPKTPAQPSTELQPTRRSLREAQAASARPQAATSTAVAVVKPNPVAKTAAPRPAAAAAPKRSRRPTKRGIISTVVMTAAAALVATMALPAYAFSTNGAFDPSASTQSITSGQQTLAVEAGAAPTVGRDNYQAPTKDELAATQAKAAADAATAAAQAAALKVTAVTSAASSGASLAVDDNAPTAPYDGQAVVDYAMQYVGKVPYGNGNTPDTSFSCDGLVQWVFKHFGVNLPRTVSNQAALGVRIPASEAQPGDVMIYPIGHTEIYAGGGKAITAPDWGRMVEYDPVWGSYYFVRYYPNS
ncbi:C40 family peptidase [Subtercola lobariae]|uniref:C40 family peptidase n=1 Tax=Subtercola lobariae TaxID=1588641 RepID=UPI00166B7E63|nr:NlpC/P60 family protein [Subtercola lobariae]